MELLCNTNLTIQVKPEEKLVFIRNHRLQKTFLWRDSKGLFEAVVPLIQASDTVDIKLDINNQVRTICPCCRESTLYHYFSISKKSIDWSDYMIIDDVLPILFDDDPVNVQDVDLERPQHTIHTNVLVNFLHKETIYFHNKCLKKTLNQRLRGF